MKLAINGGKKIRYKPFPAQRTIDDKERIAIHEFFDDTKILSGYRGNYTQNFWGGKHVKELEEMFPESIGIKDKKYKALAVNSCTSALQIACKAIGIENGDEVIVTPWSMSCSATAPMLWGGIPVFADIEKKYFCLDPKSIEAKITEKTKAIIVVDLFGQPFDMEAIMKIAEKHKLFVIEDAAQAIGSVWNWEPSGSLGHIGCFSFTQGKHLTAGEGGMILTDNEELYVKCALLRNHAEAVINHSENLLNSYSDLVGFNMRMTEIQAVILKEQLKKLPGFVIRRDENASALNALLDIFDFIKPAEIREDCTHSYYVAAYHYDKSKIAMPGEKVGMPRDLFINAVKAELTEEEGRIDRGIPIGNGYIKPLYRFPIFCGNGLCLPNVEELQNEELFITLYHNLELQKDDIADIYNAFEKVYENRKEIIKMENIDGKEF